MLEKARCEIFTESIFFISYLYNVSTGMEMTAYKNMN